MEDLKDTTGLAAMILIAMTFVKDALPESWNRVLPLFKIIIAIALCFLLEPATTWQLSVVKGVGLGFVAGGARRDYKVTVKGE